MLPVFKFLTTNVTDYIIISQIPAKNNQRPPADIFLTENT